MDEILIRNVRDFKRHLNSIEHMIYVSCKFTRTTEMLRKVIETVVVGYEMFFGISYTIFVQDADQRIDSHNKMQVLKEGFLNKGIQLDLGDYFLLKRLLMSDFESIGQYRKNLCMVSYVDGEEYVINMTTLLVFFNNLKEFSSYLGLIEISS